MKAVILAAGRGVRLGDLTEDIPKPFIPVNGIPIIKNTLKLLSTIDIEEVIIVVGYKKETFFEQIGNIYNGLKIKYIENKRWETTNNSVSLNLCRNSFKNNTGCLIVEADIFFTSNFMNKTTIEKNENSWFCQDFFMTGSQVFTNEKGYINKVKIVRDDEGLKQLKSKKTVYKSAGVVKLSEQNIPILFSEPEKFLSVKENEQYYYDVFFNKIIERFNIKPLLVNPNSWYEIDTKQDLSVAEQTIQL